MADEAKRVAFRRAYLSGPMTGMPDHNREAFRQAQQELYDLGAIFVLNPCEHWRDGDGELPDLTREQYLALDLGALLVAGPLERDEGGRVRPSSLWFDLLVSLPGWEGSEGARLERQVARAIGIECAELREVKAWTAASS